jgi:diguanylate cyclase (GGDEF)-like protein
VDQPARHLHAVPAELDPIEALGRALGEAAVAPDLRGAFGAIAGWLAPAVGAKAALIVAAGPEGQDNEASAGPVDPVTALRDAVNADRSPTEDVLVRYFTGLNEERRAEPEAPNGAVVVVLPSTDAGDDGQITSIIHAFAELAELCVAHAVRLHHAQTNVDDDPLTGCLTRRALDRAIVAEIRRSERCGDALSIAFFDIDGFKRINEERGHLQGDAVLGAVGAALIRSARATDHIGRYGGDEFVLVMPGTDAAAAADACHRLVADVAAIGRADGAPALGLSFGTATWAAGVQAAALIDEADRAMFRTRRSRDG